ncbi:MAG: Asp-tRNA(Asn)/Glu-tRNA(Gln) amidotransferase subunit GatA, partial [Kiritimatiellae bacterium]|nr:Asp-tRNA(Asn)/Glu-tRNA(Gln) amidotransferase subunit GatA [Kiritimatiellia bacterium]
MDTAALTVHAAAAALRAGRFSSVELVTSLLAAIREGNAGLNAYVWLDEEDALAQARRADAALAAKQPGALLGVPLAVKDNLSVAGQPCGCASRILEGYRAPYDATAIARLRAEGALLVGRTNMDEFAMGSTTETSMHGPSRNPAARDHVAGGSSGGSAAAIAGGLAIGSLGSDTGGSIRQPAAFCGCVGLKPSYGRVSRYGLVAFASSLDQIGPIVKDARDAALLLRVMAGHDPHDATSLGLPVPDYLAHGAGGDLRGVRLGLPREYFADGMDGEVATAVRCAVEVCRGLGARIVEVSLPHTSYAVATYYIVATAEASANLARFDGVRYGRRAAGTMSPREMYCRTRAAGFGSEVKRRILLGTYVLSSGYYDAYYLRALKARTLIRRDFEQAFQCCDALLAPVTPAPAYPFGAGSDDPLQLYLGDIFTATANLAGICALSVPCGRTGAGLPVGLQVLGPAFEEGRILRVASAYER